jgi:hypothetical protein
MHCGEQSLQVLDHFLSLRVERWSIFGEWDKVQPIKLRQLTGMDQHVS